MFYMLSGRVLAVSPLRSGDFIQLLSCVVRRPFRLLLPMYYALISNWFLSYIGIFKFVSSASQFIPRQNLTEEEAIERLPHAVNLKQLLIEPALFLFYHANASRRIPGAWYTLPTEYEFSMMYVYLHDPSYYF